MYLHERLCGFLLVALYMNLYLHLYVLMLMLLELLFIRSGAFCLDSFSVSDVKVLIDGQCIC